MKILNNLIFEHRYACSTVYIIYFSAPLETDDTLLCGCRFETAIQCV